MKKQTDFFSELHTLSINEIKRELLKSSQGTTTIYNEIVNDYRDFIYRIIGIDQFISFEETKEDFTDPKAKELKPFSRKKIARFEFEFEPPYRLVFDFITVEPNNVVRVSHLKVSIKWDKETVRRDEWEKGYERISVFAFGAFRFREACKLILSELLEPKTVHPEPNAKAKKDEEQNWFKVGVLFATGEIYPLLDKCQNNATQLAKELGNEKGLRPFISDSTGDSADRPTNIFSRPKKIKTIHRYCIENDIKMCDKFLNKYDQIEQE